MNISAATIKQLREQTGAGVLDCRKALEQTEGDLEKAKADGRDNPGRDIFIHGKAASIGCVSIGDEPIEELFVLSENTGLDKTKVVICPVDFRKEQIPEEIKAQLPNWIDQLYGKLRSEIGTFPLNK